jgi:hypothetical protein
MTHVLCTDWGISNPVGFLANGKIEVFELSYELNEHRPITSAIYKCKAPSCAIVRHVSSRDMFSNVRAALDVELSHAHSGLEVTAKIEDSHGTPIFEIDHITPAP